MTPSGRYCPEPQQCISQKVFLNMLILRKIYSLTWWITTVQAKTGPLAEAVCLASELGSTGTCYRLWEPSTLRAIASTAWIFCDPDVAGTLFRYGHINTKVKHEALFAISTVSSLKL